MKSNKYLSFCISLLYTIYLIPPKIFLVFSCSLDYSWILAINLAIKNKLVFGTDFIFNYGPMGYLCTRNAMDLSIWHFLPIDLFNFFAVALCLYKFFTAIKGYYKYILIGIPFLFFKEHISIYWSLPSFYFCLIVAYISLFINFDRKIIYLYIIATITIIGSLTKLNFGLVFFFAYASLLGYALFTLKYSIKIVAINLLYFSSLFILFYSFVFKVDFINYVKNSLILINSYNDAMFATQFDPNVLICYGIDGLVLVACFLVYASVIFLAIRSKSINIDYLTPLLVLMGLFVLYKHSILRTHLDEFHKIASLMVGVYIISAKTNLQKQIISYFYIFVLFNSLVYFFYFTSIFQLKNPVFEDLSLIKRFSSIENYWKLYKKSQKQNLEVNTACVFPSNEVLSEIGNKTVDIFPFEVTTMKLYNLNYSPRPVMQSYQVTDSFLDSFNAKKYQSEKAPDYFLYNLFALDNKNILFEETYTKLALMSNYTYTGLNFPDAYGNISLYKKYRTGKNYSLDPILAKNNPNINFNDILQIPQGDSLLVLKANIQYSFIGKLKRLFYVPSQLDIEIFYEDNSIRKFRAVLPIIQGGIICNKYIEYFGQGPERDAFMKYYGNYNKKVKSIRFSSNEPWGFNPTYNFEFYKVRIDNNSIIEENKMYPTVDAAEVSKNLTNQINGQFELLDSTSSYISLKGWIYATNTQNTIGCCKSASAIVKNGNKFYRIEGYISSRYDIAQQKNMSFNMANIGYSVLIIKEKLPKGKYELLVESNNQALANTGIGFTVN